jgi:hypothetical protein
VSALAGSFFTQSATFSGWGPITRRDIVEVIGNGEYPDRCEGPELESANDGGALSDEGAACRAHSAGAGRWP